MLNSARYYWDFYAGYARINRRARKWAKGYKRYLAGERALPPFPAVVQILPTERCNLRCKMCNQWGENGYFINGHRKATHMPIDKLLGFLDRYRALEPEFLLSIHGGEPFMYPQTPKLLDYIAEHRIDTSFSTNGTLIGRYAEGLARINRHTLYLLSIDGGPATHDQIRGEGTMKDLLEGVRKLRDECRRQGTGLPKFVVNYCVNEHNPDDIDAIDDVAREVGALFVNYNLRWFMPESAGQAYNAMLEREFKAKPSNAWTGWVSNHAFGEDINRALDRVYAKSRNQVFKPVAPFHALLPKGLTLAQAKAFYANYNELFGIKSCIMPSYWARVHATGELIYCPGHPDIVPGNVFEQDFEEVFYNQVSTQLRKRVEKELMPVCNRCCGLYMTYPATRLLGEGFVPGRPAPARTTSASP